MRTPFVGKARKRKITSQERKQGITKIDVVGGFRRKLKLTVFGGSGIGLVALFRLFS